MLILVYQRLILFSRFLRWPTRTHHLLFVFQKYRRCQIHPHIIYIIQYFVRLCNTIFKEIYRNLLKYLHWSNLATSQIFTYVHFFCIFPLNFYNWNYCILFENPLKKWVFCIFVDVFFEFLLDIIMLYFLLLNNYYILFYHLLFYMLLFGKNKFFQFLTLFVYSLL